MSAYSNKLKEMINSADDQVDSIDDSTSQIEIQIEDLEEQRNAIQYGILDVASLDMSGYLEFTKLPEKGGDYITFGVDFNVTNITDWNIYRTEIVPPDTVVYAFEGAGWDNDSEIIGLEDNWQFGYDYINHTFDTSGTYGILARINQLYNALNILLSNRTKIEDSKTEFENYAS